MSVLSGAPSSVFSIRYAAGFPTDILARGRIQKYPYAERSALQSVIATTDIPLHDAWRILSMKPSSAASFLCATSSTI